MYRALGTQQRWAHDHSRWRAVPHVVPRDGAGSLGPGPRAFAGLGARLGRIPLLRGIRRRVRMAKAGSGSVRMAGPRQHKHRAGQGTGGRARHARAIGLPGSAGAGPRAVQVHLHGTAFDRCHKPVGAGATGARGSLDCRVSRPRHLRGYVTGRDQVDAASGPGGDLHQRHDERGGLESWSVRATCGIRGGGRGTAARSLGPRHATSLPGRCRNKR